MSAIIVIGQENRANASTINMSDGKGVSTKGSQYQTFWCNWGVFKMK